MSRWLTDCRRLATELKCHTLQIALRSHLLNSLARRYRASERHLPHSHVAGKQCTCRAISSQDLEDTGRKPSLLDQGQQSQCSERRLL